MSPARTPTTAPAPAPIGMPNEAGGADSRSRLVDRGESLCSSLDPVQHLALHHERAGLHRDHPDPVAQARQAEAVAADQPRAAVLLVEDEAPHPVAVGGLGGEHALGLDDSVAHLVGAVAEALAGL